MHSLFGRIRVMVKLRLLQFVGLWKQCCRMVEIQKRPYGRSAERAWLNAFHALADLPDDVFIEAKALLHGPRSPDAVSRLKAYF